MSSDNNESLTINCHNVHKWGVFVADDATRNAIARQCDEALATGNGELTRDEFIDVGVDATAEGGVEHFATLAAISATYHRFAALPATYKAELREENASFATLTDAQMCSAYTACLVNPATVQAIVNTDYRTDSGELEYKHSTPLCNIDALWFCDTPPTSLDYAATVTGILQDARNEYGHIDSRSTYRLNGLRRLLSWVITDANSPQATAVLAGFAGQLQALDVEILFENGFYSSHLGVAWRTDDIIGYDRLGGNGDEDAIAPLSRELGRMVVQSMLAHGSETTHSALALQLSNIDDLALRNDIVEKLRQSNSATVRRALASGSMVAFQWQHNRKKQLVDSPLFENTIRQLAHDPDPSVVAAYVQHGMYTYYYWSGSEGSNTGLLKEVLPAIAQHPAKEVQTQFAWHGIQTLTFDEELQSRVVFDFAQRTSPEIRTALLINATRLMCLSQATFSQLLAKYPEEAKKADEATAGEAFRRSVIGALQHD